MERKDWDSGAEIELQFWKGWLDTKGSNWPADYAFRTDPNAELQHEIAQHIQKPHVLPLKVLDVGAGPMTVVGKRFRGVAIDLTAVDALADLYDDLVFEAGLPLVRTIKCDSECLTERFAENTFDIVYARNTLDHGYDPVRSIREMIKVAKPGGKIITVHLLNEATVENWSEFHR